MNTQAWLPLAMASLILRITLASIFGFAGIAKLREIGASREMLREFGVPALVAGAGPVSARFCSPVANGECVQRAAVRVSEGADYAMSVDPLHEFPDMVAPKYPLGKD